MGGGGRMGRSKYVRIKAHCRGVGCFWWWRCTLYGEEAAAVVALAWTAVTLTPGLGGV